MAAPVPVLPTWLAENGLSLADVGGIIRRAAEQGRMDALEWLSTEKLCTLDNCREHEDEALSEAVRNGRMEVLEWLRKQGAATAEICRAAEVLPFAKSVAVLEWLDKQGAATPDDCRAEDNELLSFAALVGDTAVLEWLASRLTLAEFAEHEAHNVWWHFRRRNLVVDTPPKVRKWLERKNMSLASTHAAVIMERAAAANRIDVLEWLSANGLCTAEECRNDSRDHGDCFVLERAIEKSQIKVLLWLDRQGAATADDCRTISALEIVDDNLEGLDEEDQADSLVVLEWLAGKLTLAEFESVGRQDVWHRVRLSRQTMLTLVLAGGRKKRLPPELWEEVEDFY
jgi:hypothetical protein